MKQVKFLFTVKLLRRVLLSFVLVSGCAFLIGTNWSASAAQINTFFGFGSSNISFNNRSSDVGETNNKVLTERGNESLPLFSIFSNGSLTTLLQTASTRATVRRGLTLNGRVEGSVQQLLGENAVFNSSAVLTGDLLVPGSPNLIRNGTSTFGGTVTGTGNSQPSNYSVTLNSGSQLGRLMTRTDATAMPTVAAPPTPTGTRNVTINNASQSIGDFATLRNLTLNGNVGNKAIPPGTYGSFTANSESGFILGTAGNSQPTVYNLASLTLNSNSQLQVVGPVIITLGTSVTLNGSMGLSSNPNWLQVKVASGGVTLNSGSVLYGSVVAPSGTVTINSQQLVGNVIADRLIVNSSGVLRIVQQSDTTPPAIIVQQPNNGLVTSAAQVTVSGTYSDESQTTITVNNIPATFSGNNFTATVPLNEGNNTLTLRAVDNSGNQSTTTRNVVRDSINPLLSVVQPSENAYLNTTTLTVLGTVEDQTITTVSVNGVAAILIGSNYTANIPINEGGNTIISIATDAAGNSTEVSRQIIRDTIPPALTIQQPANATTTPDSSVSVTGTFSDTNPVTISINGVVATISGNTYSATVPLISGPSLVIVDATDVAGNETSRERKITSATSLTMNLQQPAEQFITNSKSVRVEGTVSGVDVQVTVNGIAFNTVGGYLFGGDIDLNEGSNAVRVIATDVVGRTQETTRTVIVDTTTPVLSEISPADGDIVNDITTIIRGKVSDATTITVEINDSPVTVDSGGYFTLTDFSVVEGDNNIRITARDQVGNSKITDLTFQGKDRTAPAVPLIFPVHQETVMSFITIEGRAEPGTVLTINGGAELATAEAAFGSGLFFANVNLVNGINNLSISARDKAGNNSSLISFNVTSDPTRNIPPQQPVKINISTNDTQKGLSGQLLPRPLIARVTDKQGVPVEAVAVKFTVVYGDGQLVGGSNELTVMTNAQGQANASYVAGVKTGIHLIRADFDENLYKSVTFTAEIFKSQVNTETSISGLVLDQNLRALPNVLVRLGGQQTRTASNGRFRMTNVQSGPRQILELIGRDQVPYPGRWTNISYDIDVLPGIINNPGKPLFLPRVNAGINLPLNSENIVTQDTAYELPVVGGQPPVRVTARAGTRVTFPPDVTDRRFSVTRIDANRVPMALEEGRATNLYISVQPSGAVFEPDLEVSFPNLDGLNPNEKSLLMSFDHDAGRYVQVGTARVSADGRVVISDPGSGIRIGAWHATPPEDPLPEATVLSFIQIEGNPAFEGKDVEVTEASVLGVRAVPYSEETNTEGVLSKILLRGVVSFPRNSPVQTSKVLAYTDTAKPEIQFDDGAFDYKNKDLFLAEDKEISLSWKVIGGDGSKYTITCGQPDRKRVIVTVCNDTTITVKGVVGKFDDAGDTNFKVKAKGTKNGANDATINVNLVKVRYKENKVSSGFDNLVRGKIQDKTKLKFETTGTLTGAFIGDTFKDDPNNQINETMEPWLTVVKDYQSDPQLPISTQKAKFEIRPDKAKEVLKFVSQDMTKADVDSFDKSAKTLTVKGIATTGTATSADETKITAKLDQNAYKAGSFEFGNLQVVVRKNVKVKAAFYFLRDPAAKVNALLDPSDIDSYVEDINNIITPQTGIQYTKFRVYHWDTSKNFNTPTSTTNPAILVKNFGLHVTVDDWIQIATGSDLSNTASIQPKICDADADREIYLVHNVELLEAINNIETQTILGAFNGIYPITGTSTTKINGTIITDQKVPFVLAHEIGHSLFIRPSDTQYVYYDCYSTAATQTGQSAQCATDPTQTNSAFNDPAHSSVQREMMFKYDDNKKGYYIPKEDVDQGIKQTSGFDWFKGGFKKRIC